MTSEFIFKDSNDLKTYKTQKNEEKKNEKMRDPRSCSLLLVFFFRFICLFILILLILKDIFFVKIKGDSIIWSEMPFIKC